MWIGVRGTVVEVDRVAGVATVEETIGRRWRVIATGAVGDQLTRLRGEFVYIEGPADRRGDGDYGPVRAKIVEHLAYDGELTLADLFGLIPDLTDGLSIGEFLAEVREGRKR